MSLINENIDLIEEIIQVSKDAGESILDIYNNTDSDFQLKEDKSPLTAADISSHRIIINRLKHLTPEIPIISEEDCNIPLEVRSKWKEYWLIDPLDGTKEFINKNDEFTVNIALINNHKPVFGLIHLPVKKDTYWGCEHKGSFFLDKGNNTKKITVSKNISEPIRIAASRSHPSEKLSNILKKIENYKLLKVGSSLKFCLIASGEADIYLRFGPTSEWDTAAGEAIAKFAGAIIVDLQNQPLNYNAKDEYINPYFIVANNESNKEDILSIL